MSEFFTRLVDVRSVLAIVGTAVGFIGVGVTVLDYLENRPALTLRFERVALQSELDPSLLPERLAAIEESYGAVTAGWVLRLRDSALTLDETDPSYRDDLTNLVDAIEPAIEYFERGPYRWPPDEINYEDGVLLWPDGYNFNVARDPDMVMVLFGSLRQLEDEEAAGFVAQLMEDPRNLDNSALAILREAASVYYPRSEDNPDLRVRVARELTAIQQELDRAVSGGNQRVVVAVAVENRSRRPNAVLSGALLRLSSSPVAMTLQEDSSRIEQYSSRTLTFQSRILGGLDQNVSRGIEAAFNSNQGAIALAVEDVNELVWLAMDDMGSLLLEEASDRLKAALEESVSSAQ